VPDDHGLVIALFWILPAYGPPGTGRDYQLMAKRYKKISKLNCRSHINLYLAFLEVEHARKSAFRSVLYRQ
jgi:hypothetical protein